MQIKRDTAVGTQYGSGKGTKVDGIRTTGGTVKATGGEYAPGIGSGGGNSKVKNVKASPDTGYQGYIQDGTSLTDYTFMDGTPFSGPEDIKVGRFYTKVYFGPFRDANDIDKTSKEQIGANHLISKSGGEPFTGEQLKQLTKVTGKPTTNGTKASGLDHDGKPLPDGQISLADSSQVEKINQAKTAGAKGVYG